ncbi:MAG: chemotaxis protein [Rhodospirillales bacterium]|nr:chemotaxis protein [Rhodospirillales bacterium]
MEKQATEHSSVMARAILSPLEHIQADSNTLFSKCLFAFHAFSKLGELSENMRILSLNAELAAGRAGEHGSAVRALTQYTRELVNRLSNIEQGMLNLKSNTYNNSASAIRTLLQLKMISRADNELKKVKGQFAASTNTRISYSRETNLGNLMTNVDGMIESVENLSLEANAVSKVMSQAGSIATNIAIEASSAGAYEAEFEQVAETMREFASELRIMCEAAGGSIRDAGGVGNTLQINAQVNLDKISKEATS